MGASMTDDRDQKRPIPEAVERYKEAAERERAFLEVLQRHRKLMQMLKDTGD